MPDHPQPSASETPKRLKPSEQNLRQLYLLSGNECAFPDCFASLISTTGIFIAQTCHIEAAMPGGERFNPAMSNEQRRAPENLLLLCHRHHIETDDVENYPVERLRQIKADHERRFTEGIRRLFASVQDWTETSSLTPPRTLHAFHSHHGWEEFTSEEAEQNIAAVLDLAHRLQILSVPARQMLALILRRGRDISGFPNRYGVLLQEIEDTTGLRPDEILARVGQLIERKLAYIEEEDPHFDGFTSPYVATTEATDYPSWNDLRSYCDARGIPISDLVVELRFDLLDEPLSTISE